MRPVSSRPPAKRCADGQVVDPAGPPADRLVAGDREPVGPVRLPGEVAGVGVAQGARERRRRAVQLSPGRRVAAPVHGGRARVPRVPLQPEVGAAEAPPALGEGHLERPEVELGHAAAARPPRGRLRPPPPARRPAGRPSAGGTTTPRFDDVGRPLVRVVRSRFQDLGMRIVGKSSQKPAPSSSAARSTSVGRWAAACAGPPTAGGGPPGRRTGRPPCTSASGPVVIEAEAWGPGAAHVLEGVPGLRRPARLGPRGSTPPRTRWWPSSTAARPGCASAAPAPSPRPPSRRSASRRSPPSRPSARGGPRSDAGASRRPDRPGCGSRRRRRRSPASPTGSSTGSASSASGPTRSAGSPGRPAGSTRWWHSGPVAVAARLESIVGVGPWTSAEVNAIALGDPDAVSVGDYHLPHQVSLRPGRRAAGQRRAHARAARAVPGPPPAGDPPDPRPPASARERRAPRYAPRNIARI